MSLSVSRNIYCNKIVKLCLYFICVVINIFLKSMGFEELSLNNPHISDENEEPSTRTSEVVIKNRSKFKRLGERKNLNREHSDLSAHCTDSGDENENNAKVTKKKAKKIRRHRTIPCYEHEKNPEAEDWKDLAGGRIVVKTILIDGKPKTKPKNGYFCTISLEMFLADGSIFERNNALQFILGDGEVAPGLDEAVKIMNLDEKCSLELQAGLAYNSYGFPRPKNEESFVTMVIDLRSYRESIDPERITLKQRLIHGTRQRERGNWWYSIKDYSKAAYCYNRALYHLNAIKPQAEEPLRLFSETITPEMLKAQSDTRIMCYNNLAAALLKIEKYDMALEAANTVLAFQPENIKALFRKSKALRGLYEFEEAIACLKEATLIAPEIDDLSNEIIVANYEFDKYKELKRQIESYAAIVDKMPRKYNNFIHDRITAWDVTVTITATCLIGVFSAITTRLVLD